jgi:CubicO group peptidase (beta-lactamase class C family)
MKKFALCLVIFYGLCFPVITAKAQTEGDQTKQIDEYIKNEMKAAHIPGLAVGIVKGKEIMYLRGLGKSITPTTPFILGSTSKSFTAIGIMQLVEKQKINLDEPIKTYLPKENILAASKITVRNLLNQTSGIAKTPIWKDGVLQVNPDHIGRTFEYSNENYRLLGDIITSLTKIPYGDYVKTHIFSPLEMKHSYVSQTEAKANGLAPGYQTWFGFNFPRELPYNKEYLPAGYIISSAEDMSHFLIAQMNDGNYQKHSIVSATSIDKMHQPSIKAPIMGPKSFYGMGWFSSQINGVPTIQHSGEVPNYHSTMIIMPRENYGIVLLANINNSIIISGMIEKIGEGVVDILTEKQPPQISTSTYVQTYMIMDAILLIILVLLFFQIKKAKRWIYLLIINFLLPMAILAKLPALLGFTWSFLFDFVPDITIYIVTVCVILLITGCYKFYLILPKPFIKKEA